MISDRPGAAEWAYGAGEHWAVVGPSVAALFLGESSLGLASETWRLLAAGADIDAVVETLVGGGLTHLPSFALVERAGGSVRVLVRGTAVVDVSGPADARRVDAVRFRSWREDVVQDVTGIEIGAAGAAGDRAELPLVGGIVRASSLRLITAGGALRQEAPSVEELTIVPAAVESDPLVVLAVQGPSADITLDGSALEESSAEEAAVPEDAAEVAPPPEDDYLELVSGVTRLGSVEDAAVRGSGADDGPPPPMSPPALPPPDPVLENHPAAPDRRDQPPANPPVGLISSVPFGTARPAASRDGASAAPPRQPSLAHAAPLTGPDESELTVVRIPKRDGGGPDLTDRVGWLPAVVCGSGHPNPPESERCRVCGADLSAAVQRWVQRPILGRLRFDGPPGTVPVTGPMVIGRAPRVDGVRGDAVPTMVPVPSPEGDVSRSHLRIAVEGWHVMVVDLDATNGTVVQDPDGESRRLHPREERMIVPGTRVMLADEVGFVFEAQP